MKIRRLEFIHVHCTKENRQNGGPTKWLGDIFFGCFRLTCMHLEYSLEAPLQLFVFFFHCDLLYSVVSLAWPFKFKRTSSLTMKINPFLLLLFCCCCCYWWTQWFLILFLGFVELFFLFIVSVTTINNGWESGECSIVSITKIERKRITRFKCIQPTDRPISIEYTYNKKKRENKTEQGCKTNKNWRRNDGTDQSEARSHTHTQTRNRNDHKHYIGLA